MRNQTALHFSFFISMVAAAGCGSNVFEGEEAPLPSIQATRMLEQDKPTEAEEILLQALGEDFKRSYLESSSSSEGTAILAQAVGAIDTEKLDEGESVENLVSILASTKAQLHGIEPLTIAIHLASKSGKTVSQATSNPGMDILLSLFPVIPEATLINRQGLAFATDILGSIGRSNYTSADYFKEAIFLTCSVALITKALDTNGDGRVSTQESLSMSEANAEIFLSQLRTAAEAVQATGQASGSTETAATADQIDAVLLQIESADGASNAEKVAAFFAAATSQQ